ncbi:MAG: RnfABCDGE type electron transport complex subunit B [Clostridia bacterium]|nr:RnfABCDGE type electron transport complex subunit B [Clostridia bacterium]
MTSILIAFAVVTAVGLIAGILLALAAHFLYVPENETVKQVRECLPGINCGACGYTGCDDYAKAVAENGAKTNLCIPGADSVAADIAKVMGVEAQDVVEMVAFVGCNGNPEATDKLSEYNGVHTCTAASMIYGGPNACKYGCLGCGDCAVACPVNAICMEDGIAHVNRNICVGCGVCVRKCPKNIIRLIPQTASVAVMCNNKEKGGAARKKCKNACIACKKCELNCPSGAIKVIDNLATIDYSKCTSCGICAEVCPTKCIHTL